MDRADARAGKHRRGGLGDHRHVDHDPVTALNPSGFQQIGEAAGLFVELAVGNGSPRARLVGFEDDRGALAPLGEVAVEAIDRQVKRPVCEPFDVEIFFIERPVAGLGREIGPVEPPRLVEIEAVRVFRCLAVKLGQLVRTDVRFEMGGNGVDG